MFKRRVSLALIACLIASSAAAGPIVDNAARAIMRLDALIPFGVP
jgi:hypothetical protein